MRGGEDRLFPGATPTHWGHGPVYLTSYRKKGSGGRVGARRPIPE